MGDREKRIMGICKNIDELSDGLGRLCILSKEMGIIIWLLQGIGILCTRVILKDLGLVNMA